MIEGEPHKSEGEPPESDEMPEPLFDLGQIIGSPGAIAEFDAAREDPLDYLFRHVTGDYGDLPEPDVKEYERGIEKGTRIFSRYELETGVVIYVITEHDRSYTTMLLSEEY